MDTPEPVLPVIDMSLPVEERAKDLMKACVETGFFYVINHSISDEKIDTVFQQSKLFFQQETSWKLNYLADKNGRGYTRMGEETLDPKVQTQGDTKEGYYLGRESEEENFPLHGNNQWPDESIVPQWKEVMSDYIKQMGDIGFELNKTLAVGLGFKEDYFEPFFSRPFLTLRLLRYAPTRSVPEEGVFGCGAHSDYGMWTLLKTDDVPGLQIQTTDKRWVDVQPLESAFIVNLGDMLERWTGGLFKSTVHRVVNKQGKERFSIPFFFEPNFDSKIYPLPSPQIQEYVKESGQEWEEVISGEWLLGKYADTHTDISVDKAA
eukprot:CAMPEP_0201525402 /NCGR_PEP_ID=MMETSP0161_2-20130828/28097_1 /ASSEMBLY_ACC=CAM_ASM_000251 /TAXON_ID=180227 /ORGANISM="Neoparamoeba aestuarina, Strain SoJaBio B1-5/56/2" /LENGTH=319 /DNA_ID=CAMNT_0047925303 /DNA_START=100 /DNA_END=1059 /DNA_ORIENTATION=-